MTTNLSTNNPQPNTAPGVGEWPNGLPDPAVLARLANEFLAALPGQSLSPIGVPGQDWGETSPPGESVLRGIPAALAGGTGVSPQTLLSPPTSSSGESLYYFLESARTTSPLVLPVLNLTAPGLEPGLGLTLPSTANAADPRGIPGRSARPDATVPVEPGAMTGDRHLAAATSPATWPAVPTDEHLRGAHSASSAQPSLRSPADTAPGYPGTAASTSFPPVAPHEASGASFYFLDEVRSFAAPPPVPTSDTGATSTEVTSSAGSAHPAIDAAAIRRDFPILEERVHGKRLVWLDNGATTQKPQAVIDRLSYFYTHENSNIHRAAHELAARATDAYEAARNKVARFLHASSSDEIVFVRGTTEAINLVAQSWGRRNIGKDDEIVISWLEHHANIVPWQQLCAETGARLRVAPVDNRGQILLDEYEKLFNARTKLAAFSQVSNALGTITPVKEMVEIAHRHGALALVDGAQAVSHLRVDVQALDCDWYVFSGHKVFGPTGIGAVYGKIDLLNSTPPWQGGGNMIQDVTFERTVYQAAPARFEAGTGNIADAVGLGAALDYVERIGIDNVTRYEHDLLAYATWGLHTVPGLRLIGTAAEKAGVLSFVLEGFRTEDVGKALNQEGIAVRAGHHCAQPILRRFGLESTVRASLALYNTCEDVDALITALLKIQGGHIALPH